MKTAAPKKAETVNIPTKKKRQTRDDVIKAAEARGMTVHRSADGHVTVWRRRGLGVTFWRNGDVLRSDVRPDLCRKMTVTEAADLLLS